MKYTFPLKNKSKFDTRKFTRKLAAIIRQKTYGQKTLKKKRIRPIIRKTVVKFTNIHVPLLISSGINGKL